MTNKKDGVGIALLLLAVGGWAFIGFAIGIGYERWNPQETRPRMPAITHTGRINVGVIYTGHS